MTILARPQTFFDTYCSRLAALAAMRNSEPLTLKSLTDHAFSGAMTSISNQEIRPAQSKLAQLKIRPRELGFLFRRDLARR